MDKRLKFNEPWILQRADPYVYDKGWVVCCSTNLPQWEKLSRAYNISKRSKEIWQS